MSPEQRQVYDRIVQGPRGALRGPLLAALHRPDLADRWQEFGAMLRYGTSLPPRLSELAILVTARRWNCQLEWHIHAEIALKAGLPAGVVEDIRLDQVPTGAQPDERLVYDFTAELQRSTTVSDRTYAAALKTWDVIGVVELTALVGYYTLVAMTLNAHQILPTGVEPPLPDSKNKVGA
jgi:4-carboxymuconolactone decarboxylase